MEPSPTRLFPFRCLFSPPQAVFPPDSAQLIGSPPRYSLRYAVSSLAPLDVYVHLVKSSASRVFIYARTAK